MQLDCIKGIGPSKKKKLEKLNLTSVEDLLTYYPKRYEASKPLKKISEIFGDEEVRICVSVISFKSVKKSAYDANERLHIMAEDTSSLPVEVIFFHAKYIIPKIYVGLTMLLEGEFKIQGLKRTMVHPEWLRESQAQTEGVRPVYGLTEGVTQNEMRRLVQVALETSPVEDLLPLSIRQRGRLMGKIQALHEIHKPTSKSLYTAAKYRIVYEELFQLQMALLMIKSKLEVICKAQIYTSFMAYHDCIQKLSYTLTDSQRKVLEEIQMDLKKTTPMHRLLQGDVGSGKSIIAFLAMLTAYENGYQSALMVPTEVLAEQHYRAMTSVLSDTQMASVVLLTGSIKHKAEIYTRLRGCEPLMILGTHALIEDKVEFSNLSLIITDEQHRFGVEQRNLLQSKGDIVDVLVMSATPIPRTLSMIRYGDMDISLLDQMPLGRMPVETKRIKKQQLSKLMPIFNEELSKGHQLYFVCPLIEENEALDLQSAEKLYEKLRSYFKTYTVALLHGKQKSSVKEEIMRTFSENRIHIMVSTTVIEVGINVPNATVMCILNAERFGLAQLHQLRGRVGRGAAKGYCYLVSDGHHVVHNKRLEVLEESHDGFYIAEKDLELRGPGELLGVRQHGLPELKLANFFKHQSILERVQVDVKWFLIQEDENSINYQKSIARKLRL